MLEDIATMSDNPYYNRFYAYDMNMAQGSEYTYCAYFWNPIGKHLCRFLRMWML